MAGAARFPRSVGVIGGGTAGYLVSLALKRRFPDLAVTVVASSAIPIIGVGEATTTVMPPFLHHALGLDIVDLFREVRPTFKLGIKFVWGPPEVPFFAYPFGDARPADALAATGDLASQSLTSRLMHEDLAPIVRAPDGSLLSLLPSLKLAYHLDNAPFVAFLARAADRRGIAHLDATIATVTRDASGGVASLRAADGRELAFDLFVDATGFRAELVERALGSRFRSFASSLLCDRAVVGTVRRGSSGVIGPYTTAATMDAGWRWTIPMMDEDHFGYVHASAFLGEDEALAELRAKTPGLEDARVVRFRSGRHEDFWARNVVAVGNAYGFVEPLESTALHMVIVEARRLVAGLEELEAGRDPDAVAGDASRSVGEHFDFLRWFLAAHYRWNGRLDTPFWRAARADVDVSGLEDLLAPLRRGEPLAPTAAAPVYDATFGHRGLAQGGLLTLLLGQRAPGWQRLLGETDRGAWQAWDARNRGVAARALPHREVLDVLAAEPEMLRRFVDAPTSWCARELTSRKR